MSASTRPVVVVGAGPGGSATAARLAGRGHRVLLLERHRFPRPKPCGDCVSPAGVAELKDLGVWPRLETLPGTELRGWRIAPAAGPTFHGSFPVGVRGVALTRERLDAELLEHAAARGVEVRSGVQVVDLLRGTGGGVEGVVTADGERIRSRLVVGADGLRSVVVRRLDLVTRPPRLRKLALTARLCGLTVPASMGELHLVPRGTIGIAPVGEGLANVTVVVAGEEVTRVAGGREAYYDRILAEEPRLHGARRVSAVLATGPFDVPVRSAVVDGALLVGDAAGYYDPFTGQGIYRALRGAAAAADTADLALRRGDVSIQALMPYERARRRVFAPGERLQRVIERFVAHPQLMRAAARVLASRPAAADALVAVTGDVLPVRTLWSGEMLARLRS